MEKSFVCVVSSRRFCADIEELSDIIVSACETGVLVGIKNRGGELYQAAERIREILDGSPHCTLPQPGQWWGHTNGDRFYCAGLHPNTGEYVILRQTDTHYKVVRFSGDMLSAGWKHLPECDCFSWIDTSGKADPSVIAKIEQERIDQAESVLNLLETRVAAGDSFPQYWTTIDAPNQTAAFIRRDSKDSYTVVFKDGRTRDSETWYDGEEEGRRLLTESEAMALLNKPAEDPEEWVIQDRVPARVGVDHQRWSDWTTEEWIEVCPGFTSVGMMHGAERGHGIQLSLRCRRKDIPVVVQNVDEDWVELPPEHELRKGIDQIAYAKNCWHVVDGYAGVAVAEFPGEARCLRKDLPPIEPQPAPIEEVTEQPPEARYVVQQRTNVRDWMKDEIRWSTWPEGHWETATNGFESMRHGCRNGNAVLSVRCLEHNLPELKQTMLYRDVRPFEELPSLDDEATQMKCLNESIILLQEMTKLMHRLTIQYADKNN